jgi:thiol-disulfide isomerase/thioredoxin
MTALATLAIFAAARAEGPLSIGDSAPKLQAKEFVKGDPVKALEKGNIYVVEFWATWCGPCRESIPHLTKLQTKYKDVVFIGVSVLEQDFDKVKPFVKEMGDKMDYRVAIDSVPAGKDADEGLMNKTWLNAAEQEGIPTAFIVGKDGLIAWIGHPGELEKPLAEVVSGKYDVKAAAVAYKAEKAREKKVEKVLAKVKKAAQADDLKGAVAAIDEGIKDDPLLEQLLGRIKFQILREIGDGDKAATYARKLVENVFKDDAMQLNELAWNIVAPEAVAEKKPDAKVLKMALAAATRANELSKGEDANVLDTLGQATFLSGDTAKAIELAEKALKLHPDSNDLKDRLAALKKAKDKKEGK